VRSYYPWYAGGFGYYDPWHYGYGYNRWRHYPYGLGVGVFGYPYGFYDPFFPYGSYGYYGGGYGAAASRDDRDDDTPTGSIRLRVSPSHARVYVDGALVGTVDEFDGLTGHLELGAGAHVLELRADGYETVTTDISVRAGRTMTERAKMKQTP
jgi:hypothetical protein